jgi:cell division cycle 20-like protein 1 (cofactor of APC complex)
MVEDLALPVPSTEQHADALQTPTLISPPDTKTPPTSSHKRNQGASAPIGAEIASEPIDASALSRALEGFEQAGKVRERTPTSSPSRKRQRIYGDRYV